MQRTLAHPSQISTNVRFMFQTILHRIALRASAALALELAGAWAEHLFLRPPRPRSVESAFLKTR